MALWTQSVIFNTRALICVRNVTLEPKTGFMYQEEREGRSVWLSTIPLQRHAIAAMPIPKVMSATD